MRQAGEDGDRRSLVVNIGILPPTQKRPAFSSNPHSRQRISDSLSHSWSWSGQVPSRSVCRLSASCTNSAQASMTTASLVEPHAGQRYSVMSQSFQFVPGQRRSFFGQVMRPPTLLLGIFLVARLDFDQQNRAATPVVTD